MNQLKYVGMDAHKAMTVIAVLNSDAKELAQDTCTGNQQLHGESPPQA
jgi:hypothetical protein